MSWNKNTIKISEIDIIINLLQELNTPYKLTILGKVKGLGLNDTGDVYYEIRKLEYKDIVILERMERSKDCDADDVIVSYVFEKDKEPENWKIEIIKGE